MMTKPDKIKHSTLVKIIAEHSHISESSVRTVLHGLKDVVTEEVANGKAVQLIGLGYFFLKHQKVHWKFANRQHQERQTREAINPHFRCSSDFRNNVQVKYGEQPSYCHRSKERQEAYLDQHCLDKLTEEPDDKEPQ